MTKVDKDLISKFNTKAKKKNYLKRLKYWEQKLHTSILEDYNKISCIIRKDLLSIYSLLYSACDLLLHSQIEVESEYQVMVQKNRFDTIKLYQLICKNCNRFTTVVVDDVMGNLVERLHNFMLYWGEEYDSLSKYLKASENKFEILDKVEFYLVNNRLRDRYMVKLVSRG